MTEVPKLMVNDTMTNKEFCDYLHELEIFLSETTTVNGREAKVIKFVKTIDGESQESDLTFLPAVYQEKSCDLIIKKDDFSLVGIQVMDKCYLCSEDTDYETLRKLKVTPKTLAEFESCEETLGKEALLEAFKYFVNSEITEKNSGDHLLALTQMFCEPLRVKLIVVVPMLMVNDTMTDEDLRRYLKQWGIYLLEIIAMDDTVGEGNLKIVKRIDGKIQEFDYLTFLPLVYKEKPFDVIIRKDNFRLVGIEVKGKCYILSEDTDHMGHVKECLLSRLGKGADLNEVGVDYNSLETLAETGRDKLVLNKETVVKACEYFVHSEIKKEKAFGVHMLILEKMLDEALISSVKMLKESVPTLRVKDTMTSKYYRYYVDLLNTSLSETKPVAGTKVKVKVIKEDAKYLTLLPAVYNMEHLNVIIRTDDLYLFGIEVKGKCYLFSENTSLLEKIKDCLVNELEKVRENLKEIKASEHYRSLETLAEKRRSELVFDKKALVKAFDYFVKGEIKAEKDLGVHLLTLIQMLLEALRIKLIAKSLRCHFNCDHVINEKFLIFQHMWADASRIILSGPDKSLDLHIFGDDALTYNYLLSIMGILKNSNKVLKKKEFDNIIVIKYLNGSYSPYIKKLDVKELGKFYINELGTICEVKELGEFDVICEVKAATVYIFKKHLVLQYTYNTTMTNVSFDVPPPEHFTKSEFQLSPHMSIENYPTNTFIAFDHNANFSSATFAATLRGTNGSAQEITLNTINIVAKDLLRGAGLPQSKTFDNLWAEFSENAATSDKCLILNMPKEETKQMLIETKRMLIEIFNIKDVTPKKRKNGLKTLLLGKYINSEVLVKVTYQIMENRVVMEKLSVRCKDRAGLRVLMALLDDFEQKYCT